jgi:hypothetical protein
LLNNTLASNKISEIYFSYGGSGLVATPISSTTSVTYFTFSKTDANDPNLFGFDIYFTGTGVTFNNYELELMIVEEDVDVTSFQKGYGEIVHKKYLEENYIKHINTGKTYTFSSSAIFNATWTNDIATGWLYVNFYSGRDNEIYGELVLNGQNVMTVSRVKYSDLGFLIPIRRGDMVRLHLNGNGYEGRDCKLYYY